MKVRFWGTRGSLPKPGPATLRYGGNTSCVELRSDSGTHIILDCGSGAQDLGQALLKNGGPPSGHILISHTHWDHIKGLPFFAPLFVPGSEWDIYGPRGLYHSLREALAGQMQSTYFPIALQQFGATTRYHDLVEGALRIGEVEIRTRYLNHPALTLGYRLEVEGICIVYACDHEPFARALASGSGEVVGQDRDHADFLADADLVIHDAQYTAAEYAQKVGWGHSTVEYVTHLGRLTGAKRVALTHHDPFRDDDALDRIVAQARIPGGPEVFAAAEGQIIDIEPRKSVALRSRAPESPAVPPRSPGLLAQTILLGLKDPATDGLIADAVEADNVRIVRAGDGGSALRIFAAERPSLVVLEHDPPVMDALELCRAMRAAVGERADPVPLVVVASPKDVPSGHEPAVSDWLVRPFSAVYARTRLQAWLMRTACRWMRAPFPRDEKPRLASLRALGILDTEPEDRFDRITRLAAALFDVPIALVSLVDQDRQWFKSCYGLDSRETSREASFCAHAILGTDVMVVPDTLIDERFADNPSVIGEPRIRFYAGCPLVLPDGSCVGTLCLVDTRPRAFDASRMRLLQDLRDMVRQELCAGPPSRSRRPGAAGAALASSGGAG
ncbi:MAG TPA: GAF domain-containing protein [Geminicoccaceae bacterium]